MAAESHEKSQHHSNYLCLILLFAKSPCSDFLHTGYTEVG